MSTTTTGPVESHTSASEVAELAREKQSPKAKVGMVASYVGMIAIVLYCIIPFYWMVVSSLRTPDEGRSTEFIPNPASLENYRRASSPATTTSVARWSTRSSSPVAARC